MKNVIRKYKNSNYGAWLFNRYYKSRYYFKYNDQYWNCHLKQILKEADNLEKIPHQSLLPKKFEDNTYRRKNVILEVNNTCNLDCLMCRPSLATRKKGRMTMELLEKTLWHLKSTGVETVALHTIGDPLANPDLPKIMELLRKTKIYTSLTTNGQLLERHINTILKYRDVSSSVRFSIDGATKETYEKIRVGGKWEKILNNLELSNQKLRKKGYIVAISMTVAKDNVKEIGKFITLFRNYVDFPDLQLSFHPMSSLSPDNTFFNESNVFPNHVYKRLMCGQVAGEAYVVQINGDVTLCCRDYTGELVIGNALTEGIPKVLHGERHNRVKKAHESGDVSEFKACDTCYYPDDRLEGIFNKSIQYLIHLNKNATSEWYQTRVDKLVDILQNDKDYSASINELFI